VHLFDAGSMVNLAKRGALRPLGRGSTLDLAIYEAINAIWKEHYLLKSIEADTALRFVEMLSNVFGIMDILSVRGFEKDTFNLAMKLGISIYDASYIQAAVKSGLILVTDDKKLRSVASNYVEVITGAEALSNLRA
jgi:predicted nucleic acid-binding protein